MSHQPSALPSHSAFLGAVGDAFAAVDAHGVEFTLELTACSDELRSGGYSAFSLEFHSEGALVREQATFELRHPSLGTLHLFLVPTRADAAGALYTASFNSLES